MRWSAEFLQRFWRWAVVIDGFVLTYLAWTTFRGSLTGDLTLFSDSVLEFTHRATTLAPYAAGFATVGAVATLYVPGKYVRRTSLLIAAGLVAIALAAALAWQGRVGLI